MSKRSVLLPPHLAKFDTWSDFAAALDDTWEQLGIVEAVSQLKWLRSPINTKDVVIGTEGKLLTLDQVPVQDRETLVMTADMLGFRFYETEMLTKENYLRLCRYLAEYYSTDKGTERWAEFLGFCLDAEFNVHNTWTADYQTFYEEGSSFIGQPIERGGAWYPTTHVIIDYDMDRFAGVHPKYMAEFFNYFANLNLVLWLTRLVSEQKINLNVAVSGRHEFIYQSVPLDSVVNPPSPTPVGSSAPVGSPAPTPTPVGSPSPSGPPDQSMDANTWTEYSAAIALADVGTKRLAGANALVEALGSTRRLILYRNMVPIVTLQYSTAATIENAAQVSVVVGAPTSIGAVMAADIDSGTWTFSLEGGLSYSRYIRGSLGSLSSGEGIQLSGDTVVGAGFLVDIKLQVPEEIDEV